MNDPMSTVTDVRTETVMTERLRARILSFLFLAATCVFILLTTVLPEDYDTVFGSGSVRYQLAGILFAVSVYEMVLYLIIGAREKRGKRLPEPIRYVNATVEVTIPSIGMIILSSAMSPMYALISPFVALYFIFVILSILRLDFILSVYTGGMGALQYLVLSMLFVSQYGSQFSDTLFGTRALYIARVAMLLGAGVTAGVIARLIRRKIEKSVRIVQERNEAIDLFGQQVSEPVARELLENPGHATGTMRDVTVMFLDIRDFTPFAEKHSPEKVVSYLNEIFAELIRIVNSHDGIVNQFLGDGFMTTYGAPLEHRDHAGHAVASAREIAAATERLIEEGRIPPTRIGIGLHSGPALTGNIGSVERKQYSVTGTTVILASRIEQLNKQFDSTVLLSGATRERADIARASVEYLGPVTLKGTREPVDIYRLI